MQLSACQEGLYSEMTTHFTIFTDKVARGLALVWCCVSRNIITGNETFSGHAMQFSLCAVCILYIRNV